MSRSDPLESPFLFVKRGDPDPVEWMQAHPGWVKFPATMVPRTTVFEPLAENGKQAAYAEDTAHIASGGGMRLREVSWSGQKATAEPATTQKRRKPASHKGGRTDPIAAYEHTKQALSPACMARAQGKLPASEAPPTPLETARERAFLRLLRWEENGDVSDDVAYHARFGGHDPMSDAEMRNYVPKKITMLDRNGRSVDHYAAGAYQVTRETWNEVSKKLHVVDFTREVLDQIALFYLARDKAEESVRNGDLKEAFSRLRRRWASLPGSTQSQHSFDQAQDKFNDFLHEEMLK